ncbi:2TM domain-containing protein [Aquimarina sp. W85]|uniref:2TM domain-containing protein n=1 Tax=Aquimarina rhodophyticola TaxID=3342246 RepID=UPI00366F3C5A
MENYEDKKRYQRAKERVDELKKFYNNLFSYCIVIAFLAIINYYQNEWRNPWFLWAAFGWGIGLAFHAIKAYRINPVFDKDWEEQRIKKYMEEEQEAEQRWE